MYIVFILLGSIGFIFLLLALLSGLRVIKVKFKVHKIFGITAATFAFAHITSFFLYNFVL